MKYETYTKICEKHRINPHQVIADGNIAEIFSNSEFLLSSKINRKGHVKILKRASDGKLFSRDVNSKNDIEIFLKNC